MKGFLFIVLLFALFVLNNGKPIAEEDKESAIVNENENPVAEVKSDLPKPEDQPIEKSEEKKTIVSAKTKAVGKHKKTLKKHGKGQKRDEHCCHEDSGLHSGEHGCCCHEGCHHHHEHDQGHEHDHDHHNHDHGYEFYEEWGEHGGEQGHHEGCHGEECCHHHDHDHNHHEDCHHGDECCHENEHEGHEDEHHDDCCHKKNKV